MRHLRQNTAVRITVGPFLDKGDGVSEETALTVTSCHVVFTIDDDDGTGVNKIIDTTLTASGGYNDMVHIVHGLYDLELTAAQTNYLGRAFLLIVDSATHCAVWHEFMILTQQVYDSMYGSDKLQVDAVEISSDSGAADNLEAACDGNTYNVGGGAIVAASVTTKTGYQLAADQEVNATKIGGTTQTGRDLGASVLLSPGTGAGQVDISSGVIKSNLVQILGSALTESVAGRIVAAVKNFFDVGSPAMTVASVNQTGDSFARLGAPVGASISADIAAVDGVVDSINERAIRVYSSP